MIRSIMFSLRPLLWASIILTGMFFVFGLCFTQGVTDHLRDNDLWDDSSSADLRRYFGTLYRCALSLFEAMSGGINWGVLFDALSPLDLHFRFVFLFFVLFAIFGAANVVTGIFVEIASQWASSDSSTLEQLASEKRVAVIKRLSDLFHDLDTARDGTLTLEGMQDAMCDSSKDLVSSFHALEVEVTDVRTLFLLLDRDRKGYINMTEFLLGCFRLTGEAKTLDLLKLQYQSEWMMHNIMKILDALNAAAEKSQLDLPSPARESEQSWQEHSWSSNDFGDMSALAASHQLGQLFRSVSGTSTGAEVISGRGRLSRGQASTRSLQSSSMTSGVATG